jgi:hypothetical protein
MVMPQYVYLLPIIDGALPGTILLANPHPRLVDLPAPILLPEVINPSIVV